MAHYLYLLLKNDFTEKSILVLQRWIYQYALLGKTSLGSDTGEAFCDVCHPENLLFPQFSEVELSNGCREK
jgi:hypothetical protein